MSGIYPPEEALIPHKFVVDWDSPWCRYCWHSFGADLHNRYAIEAHERVMEQTIEAWHDDLDKIDTNITPLHEHRYIGVIDSSNEVREPDGVQVWTAAQSRFARWFEKHVARQRERKS